MKRERDDLWEAMNFFSLKTGTIVTLRHEDYFVKEDMKINLSPAWKWFLCYKPEKNSSY